MRYRTLLLDLDHTLFDFDRSETDAFSAALTRGGISAAREYLDRFRAINTALWRRVEAGELTPHDVRVARFEALLDELGVEGDAASIADDFVEGLGRFGDLYAGARELLEELCSGATLALVSNGLGEVVRAKIDRLDLACYFDTVVISGEVGVAKPDRVFFDIVFERLGRPEKATTLMIGDNLFSDIRGGNDYGIDTCWYSPNGQVVEGAKPTYRAHSFDEIAAIVRG